MLDPQDMLKQNQTKESQMKIAAITDDGKTISLHFGRAQHYVVATLENGQIVNREMRDKLSHTHFQTEGHVDEPGERHGYGTAAESRHERMAESIADCEALLCRGMGRGAYESMQSRNIRPVVTDIADINDAVIAYVNGQIVDHIEKLH
jgi:predicted Fe-Mo cluster-binding NifX family protein